MCQAGIILGPGGTTVKKKRNKKETEILVLVQLIFRLGRQTINKTEKKTVVGVRGINAGQGNKELRGAKVCGVRWNSQGRPPGEGDM